MSVGRKPRSVTRFLDGAQSRLARGSTPPGKTFPVRADDIISRERYVPRSYRLENFGTRRC